MTYWHTDMLTYWHTDILTYGHIDILKYCFLTSCWHSKQLFFWCLCWKFAFWYIDILTYRHTGIYQKVQPLKSSTTYGLNFLITEKFNYGVEQIDYQKVQPISLWHYDNMTYYLWVELSDNQIVQPKFLGWTLRLSESSTI